MTHAAARRVLCAALCVCALIALAAVSPSAQQKPEVALKAAIDKEVVEGDLKAAIGMYRTLAASADRAVAAQALLRMGQCYEKLGAAESAEARRAYATVVASFADQPQLAAQAKARLVAMRSGGATGAVAVKSGPTLRQIWPDNDGIRWNRISPDGRFVAGIDDETGDVATRDFASGEVRRLTGVPKARWWKDYGDGPCWARDGEQIAYTWYEESPSTSVASLRITDLRVGSARTVPLDRGFELRWVEDWSADGTSILARLKEGTPADRSAGDALAWVSVKEGSVRILVSSVAGRIVNGAFVSPDGRWVAYRLAGTYYDADSELFLIPVGGGAAVRLLPPGRFALVGWASGGGSVVVAVTRPESTDLREIGVLAGHPSGVDRVIRRVEAFRGLGMSASGALLFSAVSLGTRDVFLAAFESSSRSVGPLEKVSLPAFAQNSSVSWSPDGRRLAYLSGGHAGEPDTLSLWTAEQRQTTTTRLPRPAGFSGTSWSPDGRWVYSRVRAGDGREGLYGLAVESGAFAEVLPLDSGVFPPRTSTATFASLAGWSPDVSRIYKRVNYRENQQAGPVTIVEHRMNDHAEREAYRSAGRGGILPFSVSRDGTKFAFFLNELGSSSLIVMSADGGPAKPLMQLDQPSYGASGLSWSPDIGALLFSVRYPAPRPQEHWMCDVATGALTRLSIPLTGVFDLAVSPDGRTIAISAGGDRKDDGVWLLENFLSTSKAPAVPKPGAPTAKK